MVEQVWLPGWEADGAESGEQGGALGQVKDWCEVVTRLEDTEIGGWRILVPQGMEYQARSPVTAERGWAQLPGKKAAETQLVGTDRSRPKYVSSGSNSGVMKRSRVPAHTQTTLSMGAATTSQAVRGGSRAGFRICPAKIICVVYCSWVTLQV